MWRYFSGVLLRNKLVFTSVILIMTVFMAYEASRMELSYEFAKILPDNDISFVEYQNFKKQFGEDGNVMFMGFADKDLFRFEKFRDWVALNEDLKKIKGVKGILSVPTVYKLVKNDSIDKFEAVQLIKNPLTSQAQVDSIRDELMELPFYEGIIYNKETGANIVAITFTKKDLDSKRRLGIVKEIKELGDAFSKKYNVDIHYSGMPYIRSQLMTKVSHEMGLFLALAVLVTAVILWLFFRSVTTVVFSLIVVVIGVVWSIGIMELFGYKITVLSGLIAPLIMVIG
ncbi:MAG TPA: MMPL family transporter, partial [Bacteroidia bacterium]|nr:MMPL family transporter [Bacteroidia bacterium]